jgi:hypothetical protein
MTASGMGEGVEDSAMSVWTMPSGATVSAHESFTHPFAGRGRNPRHGRLDPRARVMTQRPGGEVVLVDAAGRHEIPYADHDLYERAVGLFAAAAAGDGRPSADGVDGVKSLAVALAVREAAETGRRVRWITGASDGQDRLRRGRRRPHRGRGGGVGLLVVRPRCPDKVLAAIGARFDTEGHPRNLTTLHPIAAGDMYGIKGIDHIAKDGLLSTIVAGSYPSGPSSLPMPEIWRMLVEERVAAYNVPSGILFDMHRDVAARRPGVFTKVGLDTFVDPIRQGCAMNGTAAGRPIVSRVELAGETWLHFPNIVPNVAIIRATTADERGKPHL